MQYHFIVMYDDDTGEFSFDGETEDISAGPLWDPIENEWVGGPRTPEEHDTDDTAMNVLRSVLVAATAFMKR